MRREPRASLNAANVASLALCVIILALWIQSHSGGGFFVGRVSRRLGSGIVIDRQCGFFSKSGSLGFVSDTYRDDLARWSTYDPRPPVASDRTGFIRAPDLAVGPYRDGKDLLVERGFGFGRVSYGWAIKDTRFYVMIPHWFALLISGGLATGRFLWRFTSRLWRSPRNGRCPACGNDLRATPDGCPECGTITAR